LAFQVPGNFGEPSHTIRADIAERAPYAEHVRDVAVPASHEPADYLAVLLGLGCEADVWETTYFHVLTGEDPVFDWVSGTGARPTIQALPEGLREEFEDEFRALLRAAYPADPWGRVVMPFRRIFAVARRPA
jgi:trans-aconitate 2-methyltransferase